MKHINKQRNDARRMKAEYFLNRLRNGAYPSRVSLGSPYRVQVGSGPPVPVDRLSGTFAEGQSTTAFFPGGNGMIIGRDRR